MPGYRDSLVKGDAAIAQGFERLGRGFISLVRLAGKCG